MSNRGALAQKFTYPPFTVLDGRTKWWADRKRRWLDCGIESEAGRKDDLLYNAATMANLVKISTSFSKCLGVSVFDPVVCELAYTWFSRKDTKVFDPFAGGSVRGLIAALLGRRYLGLDIRQEQVDANFEQLKQFNFAHKPSWRIGDAVSPHNAGVRGKFDLIFTCPPYGDLERYSDRADDLSNMPYQMFIGCFRESIMQATRYLNDNRFAVIVVGDFRDKNGIYRGFVADTIMAFRDAGLSLYNDAVLLTPLGTLPVRAGGAFKASRKLGKAHQNFLVFVKGDPKKATEFVGPTIPHFFDDD